MNLNLISRVVIKTILLVFYLCLDLFIDHFYLKPFLPLNIQLIFLFKLKFRVDKNVYRLIDDIELLTLEVIY